MKNHQFYLAGEYFTDRDWKELLGKAEEIDGGFCLRGKDVSADECHLLQILRKIAFETIGISEDEAHKVKEAAEDINCVDHGVCVIDYNSRPYLVGPKAQVHAAKEEIIYTLEKDGVDCRWTVPKTRSMTDDSKDENQNNDTVYGRPSAVAKEVPYVVHFSDTESDEESGSIEYVMKKTDFRLAEQYFKGCNEHQYFGKAKGRDEGFLFTLSSRDTKQLRFLKSFRKMKFDKIGHVHDDKPTLKAIADQLRCKDLGVKVLECGSKSYLVGPKEKVTEIKPKFMSKLQENEEAANSLDRHTLENSSKERSQPGIRHSVDSPPWSSYGGAGPKKFVGMKSSFDNCPYKYGSADASSSPFQGQRPRAGLTVDQCLVCGISSFAKRKVKSTSCCGIPLCSDCCDKVSFCTYCRQQWKIRTGNQPDGYMEVSLTRESADGFESRGSWKIQYSFPSGTQGPEHPNPGQVYSGTKRTAYIPAIEGSMDLLKLLRLAFIRRLTFTIGRSQTTGKDNSITWNDIHHKTSLHGGSFGFPDPFYFQRILQELRDKGVTLDSMTEKELRLIKGFDQCLISAKHFSDHSQRPNATPLI